MNVLDFFARAKPDKVLFSAYVRVLVTFVLDPSVVEQHSYDEE